MLLIRRKLLGTAASLNIPDYIYIFNEGIGGRPIAWIHGLATDSGHSPCFKSDCVSNYGTFNKYWVRVQFSREQVGAGL